MLQPLLLGAAASLVNIAIHAAIMVIVVATARYSRRWHRFRFYLWLVAVMVASSGVLVLGHLAEVAVWAFAYAIFGVAPAGSDPTYFAFVNYTTLGYGDVIPVQRWRLLGPMTAMNGILLFGWSTAVMFEVLRRAIHYHEEGGWR